jgi:DNA-binding LacI/PurR family transcriptional regulator
MKFSQETYERVISAAEKLGYQAATLKRAIKRPLKHIGFVATAATNLESTFMREIISGVYDGAEAQGYMVMVKRVFGGISTSSSEEEQKADAVAKKMIELVSSKVLDGVIVDKSRFGDPQIEMLEKAEVPFICINGRTPIKGHPVHEIANWVCIDHVQGGRIASEQLSASGTERSR